MLFKLSLLILCFVAEIWLPLHSNMKARRSNNQDRPEAGCCAPARCGCATAAFRRLQNCGQPPTRRAERIMNFCDPVVRSCSHAACHLSVWLLGLRASCCRVGARIILQTPFHLPDCTVSLISANPKREPRFGSSNKTSSSVLCLFC